MAGTPEPDRGDDRDAIDRAFAELVAGYHLTADRPDPTRPDPTRPDGTHTDSARPDPARLDPGRPDGHSDAVQTEPAPPPAAPEPQPTAWAADHPLFRFEAPPPEPEPEEPEERFVPPPPPPLGKPAWPVLLAWLGMGYAILMVLAVVVGARLPGWTGWLALVGFVGGFAILVARLPRHRPPDAGDGAVL